MIRTIEGDLLPPRGRLAIVASRFNDLIVDQLVKGAVDTFKRHGIQEENIDIVWVPGAFEIPFACQRVAKTGRYSGVVSLGAVIRGATPHFDYVASNCASGVASAMLTTDIPMTLGVLTTDTIEQAIERAGTKAGNKGIEAACALIELVNVVTRIED